MASRVQRPNLLFVFPDQMRAEAMGCAGNPDVVTPSLDALAASGVQFTHAIASCPVCTPSRGTILTGRYPLAHRAASNDLPLPETERTFGEILSNAGWRTGYIGKWHLDGVPRDGFTPPGPRRHGFEYWAAWNCAHAYFQARYFRDLPQAITISGYEPDGQTDLALDFIGAQRSEPWALFLSWGPPHPPYRAVPETDRQRYNPEALTLRGNAPHAERQVLADYYAAITALDRDFGRLMALLDELHIAEHTLVVFTSDHGDMLFSHDLVEKQKPYDEAIRVPLIMRLPETIPAGKRSPALITTADLLPTILGLLGVDSPGGVQGQDLSAFARGREDAGPASAFLLNPIPVDHPADIGQGEWRGVRTPRYTYAAGLEGPWLLFDNDRDPMQLHNLVDDAGYADVQADLRQQLQRWLDRTADPFVPWAEHVRLLDAVEAWNRRERVMHPARPRLVEA